MEDRSQARLELRALLADPSSTQEQRLRAKLVLAKRIADVPNGVIEVCRRYGLTQEQTECALSAHRHYAAEFEREAEEAAKEFECLLSELIRLPEIEPSDV